MQAGCGWTVSRTCRHLLRVVAVCLSIGCDNVALEPHYYWHLATGQLRILADCRSIETLLSDTENTDELTRQRLAFIRELRSYAAEEIGLSVSSSYSCYYDTKGHPVSWNVSASLPERFEPHRWSFPIVGALPYKGFFSKSLAIAERDSLRIRGLDVLMRQVSAYSTLGYFSDPVLSTMLDYSDDSLADLIFHELTHSTVFVEGHTDFNESLASFVGKVGSLRFMTVRHGGESEQVRQIISKRRDAALFRQFLFEMTGKLDSLYALDLPKADVLLQRVSLFESAKEDYKGMRHNFDTPERHDRFLDWEINNARLLSYRRYHNLDIFERQFEAHGRDLRTVLELSVACEESADPWDCLSRSLPQKDHKGTAPRLNHDVL